MPAPSDTPVLIVTGPPGAGKTTAAAILAARAPRAVHLEADAFFRFISAGYVEPWKRESQEQNEVVMRIVAAAAASYAAAGYFTVVEGIVIPSWFLEPLREALHEAGRQVAYAVLRVPLEVCTARVRDREGEAPIEAGAIAQLWRSFADLGPLEQNAVEVDGRRPDEVADVLAQRLEQGLLAI